MIGKLAPYGIHIKKGLWAFRENILRDGFQRFLLKIPDGGNGIKNIPILSY
jgi:hypothetical protein